MIDNMTVLALTWGCGVLPSVPVHNCSSGVGNEMNSDMYKLKRYRICSALEVYAAVLLSYFFSIVLFNEWPCHGEPSQFITILQSQSKLLGDFTVSSPSQCWCTRIGESSAINNIRSGTGSDEPEVKKRAFGGSVRTIFV